MRMGIGLSAIRGETPTETDKVGLSLFFFCIDGPTPSVLRHFSLYRSINPIGNSASVTGRIPVGSRMAVQKKK